MELRTRCRVREITTDEHGMAAGAIYYDADGKEHFQPAEVVILACNGVGTPRLLLNSASARFPNGLANSSGLVGKNLMLHPWPMVSGYVEETLDGGRGAHHLDVEQAVLRDRHLARLRARLHAAIQPRHGPGEPGDHQRRRPASCHGGATIIASSARCSSTGSGIGVACEDLPEEHNRVTLDPVLKDSNGIPAPKIDYTISENTHRMMEHGIARAEEILTAAGAKRLYCSRTALNSPGHLLGHRAHGQRSRALGGERVGPLP